MGVLWVTLGGAQGLLLALLWLEGVLCVLGEGGVCGARDCTGVILMQDKYLNICAISPALLFLSDLLLL